MTDHGYPSIASEEVQVKNPNYRPRARPLVDKGEAHTHTYTLSHSHPHSHKFTLAPQDRCSLIFIHKQILLFAHRMRQRRGVKRHASSVMTSFAQMTELKFFLLLQRDLFFSLVFFIAAQPSSSSSSSSEADLFTILIDVRFLLSANTERAPEKDCDGI